MMIGPYRDMLSLCVTCADQNCRDIRDTTLEGSTLVQRVLKPDARLKTSKTDFLPNDL